MSLQENIRRVLKEGNIPTETDYLGWFVPKKLYDELETVGIKIPNKESDKVYVAEIHFDTKYVVFEIVDSSEDSSFELVKIGKLPKSILPIIVRRLKPEWVDYLQDNEDGEELNEGRVPRSERVELYKDENIIVVVPLTHRALQKYAHQCQWCINDDLGEWEDYHKGKHAVIIQRNPKRDKIGISGRETDEEIFLIAKFDNGESTFDDICKMLEYDFLDEEEMKDYYVTISNDINNFSTNIVYYSPEGGVYDMGDNYLWNFNYEITDIPNVTPEVIQIMDDYLQENEEMSLQESIKRVLNEETQRISNEKLIEIFYSRLTKQGKLNFKGIILIPELDEDDGQKRIIFNIDNPNDLSYSQAVIENYIDKMFNKFIKIFGLDRFKIQFVLDSYLIVNTPEEIYINKTDYDNIRQSIVNVKKFRIKYRFKKVDLIGDVKLGSDEFWVNGDSNQINLTIQARLTNFKLTNNDNQVTELSDDELNDFLNEGSNGDKYIDYIQDELYNEAMNYIWNITTVTDQDNMGINVDLV